MEEGVTLAWSDLNVYANAKDKSSKSYKRIITEGMYLRMTYFHKYTKTTN